MSVFTRLLLEQGHAINLFDLDAARAKDVAERYNASQSTSVQEAVSFGDLILICATTNAVPGIIDNVKLHAKKGTIISEIASHKDQSVPALRQSPEFRGLSIHPLFGPDITTFKEETIAVVTVHNSEEEMETAKALFPESKLVPIDPESHDRCMASVLSLPYFMNLVFASVLTDRNLPLLKELAGPTFDVQLAVTQSIVGESPSLIRSLINDNVFSWPIIQEFMDEANQLTSLLRSGSNLVDPFLEELKDSTGGKNELESARKYRNKILELIKKG